MINLYQTYGYNFKLENTGQWFTLPQGGKFKLKFVNASEHREQVALILEQARDASDFKELSEDEILKLSVEERVRYSTKREEHAVQSAKAGIARILKECVVCDWADVSDEAGEALPCNKETRETLFTDARLVQLWITLWTLASDQNNFRIERSKEEIEKN